MSVQRKFRRELTRSFRNSPRPLIDAVVIACDIPPIEPTGIRPYSFDRLDPATAKQMGGMLGWQVDLRPPMPHHFVLLLDVVTALDEERMWNWQLWRTRVRADAVCPAWLAVCVANEGVLTAIRKAFDHEPTNLPILITPDAKVLDVPRRPAPRPSVGFRV